MGERKVLNKYFPPDFDPKKVPRMKRDPEKQIGVRMMLPFTVQCSTCGEFMYRGKKFNSLKEDCIGEDYLGIRRFRFYIKCVICSQEITFKTDPENGDYELETGATRNFESWTDKKATEDEHKKTREEEEKSDNMKQLENRTLDSKIELEIMDALDEIKAVNRRHERVDTEDVLKASAARREKSAAVQTSTDEGGPGGHDDDEALIAKIQFGGPKIRRLTDDDGSEPGDATTPAGRTGKAANGDNEKGKKRERAAAADGAQGDLNKVQGPETASVNTAGAGAAGSLLVTGIEAQARREAERAKAAASAVSMGTKIVAKRKIKRNKGDAGGGSEKEKDASKKRKKNKNKERESRTKPDENGGAGVEALSSSGGPVAEAPPPGRLAVATANGGGAGSLGGLNLLGSYGSASDSDGAT